MGTALEKPDAKEQDPATIDVSIVIPCLNEEDAVGGTVRQAREWIGRSGARGEVIVIDNGSEDRTAAVAQQAGARVITEPRRGKGHAVRTGIAAAEGKYIVMADGDGTYDLTNLKPLLDPLANGYDMVIGNRLKGEMKEGSMPRLHRYVGNPLFTALISLIARRRFGDVLSGLRSFRREAWDTMSPMSPGFELESEVCLRASRSKLRVVDTPIPYGVRASPSKLRGFAHGWAIVRFIILESADLIFFFPAFIAAALGIMSLAVGLTVTTGVDVGSFRWQPVFAGGILVPAGVAFMALGAAAKWQAWRRGLAPPGRVVRAMLRPPPGILELMLIGGLVWFLIGIALDAYLLFEWMRDEPPRDALGLGAIAQTLILTGLNLIVGAVLLGILRSDVSEEHLMDRLPGEPTI